MPPNSFVVPVRTSSKRPLSFEKYTTEDKIAQNELESELKKCKTTLKPKLSLDADYYQNCSRFAELSSKRVKLQHKKSKDEFATEHGVQAFEEDWTRSDKFISLSEQQHTFEIEAKLYKAEAEKRDLGAGDEEKVARRHFMQLYTQSKKGLGIDQKIAGAGTRDSSIQSEFRKKVFAASGMKHSDPRSDDLWCPVLAEWIHPDQMHAAHSFPWDQGQAAMDDIFGRINGRPELNEPENGLMLSVDAEAKISKGIIAIVPNLPDKPNEEQMENWQKSVPQDYKIRILDWNHRDMEKFVLSGDRKGQKLVWKEMDGKKIEFCTNHRPRARYLYWRYCVSILRRSWNIGNARKQILNPEIGNKFLGSRGSYLSRRKLLALVEEMGHSYEHLLEQACDEGDKEETKSDPVALIAATTAIRRSRRDSVDDDDDDEEDDDDIPEHRIHSQ